MKTETKLACPHCGNPIIIETPKQVGDFRRALSWGAGLLLGGLVMWFVIDTMLGALAYSRMTPAEQREYRQAAGME